MLLVGAALSCSRGVARPQIASDGRDATQMVKDEKPHPPQPHRKTQVVARPNAIAALLRQPGWDVMLADAMRVQSRQTATFAEQLGDTCPAVDTAATRRADEMMRGYEAGIRSEQPHSRRCASSLTCLSRSLLV